MTPLALLPPDPTIRLRSVRLTDAEPLHAACWPSRAFDAVYRLILRAQHNAEAGRGLGLVALDAGDSPVGFGQFALWPTCAEISDLVVSEPQRGRGLGTALIQRLIQEAQQRHATVFEIGAALSNPRAISLYRRLGFRDSHTVLVNLGSGQELVLFLRLELHQDTGG